jgi:hypothetical protein
VDVFILNSNTNTNNNEHCGVGSHQVEQVASENELWGTKFEGLVLSKGP